MREPNKSRYFINSLNRGLLLLSTFSAERPALTASEIAKANSLTLPTCARYLLTLRDLGYIEQDPALKKYKLTAKILSLGFPLLKNMDLKNRLVPHMVKLTKEFDVTTQCAILDGTEIVFMERVRSSQVVNLDLTVGSRLPCYCTALGKAILAFLEEQERNRILNMILFVRHTPYTIMNLRDLKLVLKETRERGYSINHEELTMGLRTIALPIFRAGTVEGAFGMSYPLYRVEGNDLEESFVARMKEVAEKVSI